MDKREKDELDYIKFKIIAWSETQADDRPLVIRVSPPLVRRAHELAEYWGIRLVALNGY